ncbi:MAG: hypothetical protein R3F18_00425 [Lysobacterales bacterium]|nr:hypothetical protein [Xanthomonadales bacterium]MCB1612188.1 hypothetical protein [Xanthomonadales bacterium]MCP5476794.1 hypothetical protein [Rhodanobacteraceae bacterium]
MSLTIQFEDAENTESVNNFDMPKGRQEGFCADLPEVVASAHALTR